MLPSSEDVEAFALRLRDADVKLSKLKGAEVTRPELILSLAALAKDWFRMSQKLRASDAHDVTALQELDASMNDVLNSTSTRARASAYRKKLDPLLNHYNDAVLVPLIRFEGSPRQVAARQLQQTFQGTLASEEAAYVHEASKCVGAHCFRAAIIMLWAAGIARMHRAIEAVGFSAFNAAVAATTKKKGDPYKRVSAAEVTSLPELQKLRDFDLIVLGMELWRYDLTTFQELDRLLGTRNGAAHPGMLQPNALDVQQYASKLAAIVFSRIGV
jgi:hypothetical protein